LDQVKALAPQHPEWHDRQPFKAVLEGDRAALAASGEKGSLEIMAATYTGMTTDEFQAIVADWLATARHPRFDRPYTELAYQPMLELLDYLRERGFKTFIVSGGGIEFVRMFTERVYGIPPEQVVGSSGVVEFEMGPDGKPVVIKEAEVKFVDDGPGKPVGGSSAAARSWPSATPTAICRCCNDYRGRRTAVRPHPAPHRRRARMGLRSREPDRSPRQGARCRGPGRLGNRVDEGRLEDGLRGNMRFDDLCQIRFEIERIEGVQVALSCQAHPTTWSGSVCIAKEDPRSARGGRRQHGQTARTGRE
jgi:haloacid dehalogenase-like hydrolase